MVAGKLVEIPGPIEASAARIERIAMGLLVTFGSLAQRGLLVLIAFFYSGGGLFLVPVSRYLLTGCYVLMLGLTTVAILARREGLRPFGPIALCLIWLLAYCLWGTWVSPIGDAAFPQTFKILFRGTLLLGILSVALRDSSSFAVLARMVQAIAIGNCALAIWQKINPSLITTIAYTIDAGQATGDKATAFSLDRPAGLWSNPDEASFAYIFALLLSAQLRGRWVWVARCAAVVGIYLSASRTGAYLLVLCVLAYLIWWFTHVRWTPGRLILLTNGGAFLALCTWLGFMALVPTRFALPEDAALHRILDITESRSGTEISRSQLTQEAAAVAFAAPWQGYGIFALQSSPCPACYPTLRQVAPLSGAGAHNIYLTILGEVGLFGAVGYGLFLVAGMRRLLVRRLLPADRFTAGLMWGCFLLLGLVWHNLFTSIAGILYLGLLYLFPVRMQTNSPHPERSMPSRQVRRELPW